MTVWGSTKDQDVYTQRLALFHEANPNITVELLYTPDNYSQRVQTMIAGGESSDIIQLAEDVHGYSDRGQLLGLNAYLEFAEVDLEARFGTLHEQYMLGGELYALPDRGGAMILYYNLDIFDAAGIDYPTADWTWDNFLAAAQALTIVDDDGEVSQYGFAAGGWWPWWMSFIYQNGGRILDEEGNPTVNTPEVIEALQFYTDLMYEYGVAPDPEDYANMGFGWGQPDPLFAQGGTAMKLTGIWNFASLRNVPDLNWDIAPVWQNVERGTVSFGSGLAVSADTEHPEEAFAVIEFLTSAPGQLPIVSESQDPCYFGEWCFP